MLRTIIQKFSLTTSLIVASLSAAAMPVTFEFSMPNWTHSVSSSIFGTNAVLQVTFDNGASSATNQTYLNNQIVSLSMYASGGSYSHTWSGEYGEGGNGLSQSYVSTDSSGVATLNLTTLPVEVDTSAVFASDADNFVQLGRINTDGGYFPFYVQFAYDAYAYVVPVSVDSMGFPTYSGFTVTSSSTAIPEPSTIGLFVLALANLITYRRKH